MTMLVAAMLVLAVATFVALPLFTAAPDEVEAAPAHGERWAGEKAAAVLAITEADFDLATGKLSDDDYAILRSDYEERALQAMDAMEKSVADRTDGPVRYCAGCGSPFSDADAFCGSCGRRRYEA